MSALNFKKRDAEGAHGDGSRFAVFGRLGTYYQLLERLAELKDEVKAFEELVDEKEEKDSVVKEKKQLAKLTNRIRAHTKLISELSDQIPPAYDYYSLLSRLQTHQQHLKQLERDYHKDKIPEGAFQAKRTNLRQKISGLETNLGRVLTRAQEYISYLRSQLHSLEDTRLNLKSKRYRRDISKEAYAELKAELEEKKKTLREKLKYTHKRVIVQIRTAI